MNENDRKHFGPGFGALVVGGMLGVVISDIAHQEIASKSSFGERVAAIQEAIKNGQITTLHNNQGGWHINVEPPISFAEWLVTFAKAWDKTYPG